MAYYYNPQSASVDGAMQIPLEIGQYPCKGYHKDLSITAKVSTLTPGQPYTVILRGDNHHQGGSCQFGLSYDGGANFGVVYSIIGGCPTDVTASYTFIVPPDLPSGKNVIFAWSWWAKVGAFKSEIYQNCAHVEVAGNNTQSITVPRMFEANKDGCAAYYGKCCTEISEEVVMPNPGRYFTYGGQYRGTPNSRLLPPSRYLKGCRTLEDVVFYPSV